MRRKMTQKTTGIAEKTTPQVFTRREKGQSLVEFSFVLVILLILIAGISDLGRGLFTYLAMRDAAQEGALYASINPTAVGAIENRVINSSSLINDLATGGATPAITVVVSYTGDACNNNGVPDNGVQVTVEYQEFPITMPFLGAILGTQHVPIRASIVDTILSPACPQMSS